MASLSEKEADQLHTDYFLLKRIEATPLQRGGGGSLKDGKMLRCKHDAGLIRRASRGSFETERFRVLLKEVPVVPAFFLMCSS